MLEPSTPAKHMALGTPGIYMIKCLSSGNFYIGSTESFGRRYQTHFSALRLGKNRHPGLQEECNKYGVGSFEFSIVEIVENTDNLLRREQFWIDALKPQLNRCKFSDSRRGLPLGPESRKKISASLTGRKLSPESVAKREATCRERGTKKGVPKFADKPYPESARVKASLKLRGEKNPAAHLNTAAINDIRSRLSAGARQQTIADSYGISQAHVSRIKLGKSWSQPPVGGV